MIELWGQAVRSIEAQVKPAHRNLWLRPIKCVAMDGERIRLQAPNRYHKEWFEDRFLPAILRDLENQTKTSFQVDFEISEDATAPAARPAPTAAPRRGPLPAARPPVAPCPAHARELDERFAFDSFVVGGGNEFAHSAARMAAAAPAVRWNPLFIYGGVGLGKTHLLHAVGHEIRRQHPDWTIRLVTCEEFVGQFVGAIVNQRKQSGPDSPMERFRARYRDQPDVLLIDDIQFLCKKDSSQDEFFHTFNALHHARKQIVLTCDKLPAELPGFDQRLTSRFSSGLVVAIRQPDLDTRVAIVKRKAELSGLHVPDDVALAIATRVTSNVRQLEGALLHVSARATLCGHSLSKEFTDEVLRTLVRNDSPGLTVEAIQTQVAASFGIPAPELKGAQRCRAVARPRMVAMYLARKLTTLSYPEIGQRFGGKDHTTVLAASRKIERLLAEDAALRSMVSNIENRLRQG